MAKESPERYHWRVVNIEEEEELKLDNIRHHSALHPDLYAPFKTEFSYLVDGETDGCDVYIVAFALSKLNFTPGKLKFLSGVGYAIYVAAFDLDENEDIAVAPQIELDVKEFLPRPIRSSSQLDFNSLMDAGLIGNHNIIVLLNLFIF